MKEKELPLHEVSINELFKGNICKYEIPIYQRNYAWGKVQVEALINDVYDSFQKDAESVYYIGTLVSYKKDDNVYEIIDGQQRLTTISIILKALEQPVDNRLTYRARKKSDKTLERLPDANNLEEKDEGIIRGYNYAKEALKDELDNQDFINYFLKNVHIIHYQVPRDIDLNHYFEVMNSRGEQLEKHEIVKAQLMQRLDNDDDRKVFNKIWEACSNMSVYVQQNINRTFYSVYKDLGITPTEFEQWYVGEATQKVINKLTDKLGDEEYSKLYDAYEYCCASLFLIKHFGFDSKLVEQKEDSGSVSISDILSSNKHKSLTNDNDKADSFRPIIDFPNFLLIVLKITLLMDNDKFNPTDFILDDKELLNDFNIVRFDANNVKIFAHNLLKARFFLDNYVVHHSNSDEKEGSNPWQLQVYATDGMDNLCSDQKTQDRLVQLLSMFEVTFEAHQRKNYLFYILNYLVKNDDFVDNEPDTSEYLDFVENLAESYMCNIYLDIDNLTDNNKPRPNCFDEVILNEDGTVSERSVDDFIAIYGDGTVKTNGIPQFVFNYLDYKIWSLYHEQARGKKRPKEHRAFFEQLGCNRFDDQKVLNDFYFSSSRSSLEHFYPQSTADGECEHLNQDQINCFGNFAMISPSANSMGSNWDPATKIVHYMKDASGKINRVGVSSLKLWVMMQMCKDRNKWDFEEIQEHQENMVKILLNKTNEE